MPKIREVLYQHAKGNSQRLISRSLNISRDTVRKYIEFAKQEGFNSLISDVELNNIAIKVENELYKNEPLQKASAMITLSKYEKEISGWLEHRSITHTQIQRLLLAEYIQDHFLRNFMDGGSDVERVKNTPFWRICGQLENVFSCF